MRADLRAPIFFGYVALVRRSVTCTRTVRVLEVTLRTLPVTVNRAPGLMVLRGGELTDFTLTNNLDAAALAPTSIGRASAPDATSSPNPSAATQALLIAVRIPDLPLPLNEPSPLQGAEALPEVVRTHACDCAETKAEAFRRAVCGRSKQELPEN